MSGSVAEYDFDRYDYILGPDALPIATARRENSWATMFAIGELTVRLMPYTQIDEAKLPVSRINSLQRFVSAYESYFINQQAQKANSSFFPTAINRIQFTFASPFRRLQGMLLTLFKLESVRLQTQYQQAKEQVSLLELAKQLGALHPAMHTEAWVVGELQDLKARVIGNLNGLFNDIPAILLSLRVLDRDLSWFMKSNSKSLESYEAPFFCLLRQKESTNELIALLHDFYGNSSLIEDFSVLLKNVEPELAISLRLFVEANRVPIQPGSQENAKKTSRKCVDSSLDQRIPELSDPERLSSELPKILQTLFPHEQVISESQASQIASRMLQLAKTNERAKFTRTELLKLAYFLDITRKRPENRERLYLKKQDPYQIPCSLIVNAASQTVFCLLKSRGGWLRTASCKKVTLALEVPQESSQKVSLVAQSVSRSFRLEVIQSIMQEIRRWSGLKNPHGVWPLLFACWYRVVDGVDMPTTFSPLAEGTLYDIKRSFSVDELYNIAKTLIFALHSLHSQGLVHGDLNATNVLFGQEGNGGLKIGLNDFGHSFHAATEPASVSFTLGYYGSIFETAPEVFGEKDFHGNYFATEIWALGFVLHYLAFRRYPAWTWILNHYYTHRPTKPVPDYAKQIVYQLVREEIDKPLEKLQQPLTPEDSFIKLIYTMLQSDFAKRPDITTLRTI